MDGFLLLPDPQASLRQQSAPDPETVSFSSLPRELVVAMFIKIDVFTLGCTACVSQELRRSVEDTLRARSDVALQATDTFQLLCWRERRGLDERMARTIAAGAMHSAFAEPTNGQLLTCGTDEHRRGYLGQGAMETDEPLTAFLLPAPLRDPLVIVDRVVAVAAHTMHTLALTASGAVYSFGDGSAGKLGHGEDAAERVPRRVEALGGVLVTDVSVGQQHTLALDDAGVVYSWGSGFR